jgi:hypothetical protein
MRRWPPTGGRSTEEARYALQGHFDAYVKDFEPLRPARDWFVTHLKKR